MGLLFQHEIIAESVWRAMGWACNEESNTVISSITKKSISGEVRDGDSAFKQG